MTLESISNGIFVARQPPSESGDANVQIFVYSRATAAELNISPLSIWVSYFLPSHPARAFELFSFGICLLTKFRISNCVSSIFIQHNKSGRWFRCVPTADTSMLSQTLDVCTRSCRHRHRTHTHITHRGRSIIWMKRENLYFSAHREEVHILHETPVPFAHCFTAFSVHRSQTLS